VPLPFAPFVGFLVGLGLAWAARAEIGNDDGPLFASRPFAVAGGFAWLVYAPIVGYFVAFHGDWAYLYLVDWAHVPSAVDLALVLLAGASVPLGTIVALPAARARRLGTVVRIGAAPAVVVCGLLAWSARRLVVSATYTQFHGDFGTESIASSALGRGILWMGIVGVLGIAWSVRLVGRSEDDATAPASLRRGQHLDASSAAGVTGTSAPSTRRGQAQDEVR
jgi:hypothetical protein